MRRSLLSLRLPLAAALFALAAAAPAPAQISTTYFLGSNYGTKPRTDPLYPENAFDLYYPLGGCPLGPGCANTTYPVVVFIHGGNSNAPSSGPSSLSPLNVSMLSAGFVVVLPSYHVIDVDAGDDYQLAAADLTRVVQYLRRFHAILNIDPDRVFALGHSGGGFYSYYLGLNADAQELASPDLVERESSRPNFVVAWGAATDWSCMDLDNPLTNPVLLEMFQVTQIDDAINASSPTYWLQNPELYGRSFTPPMCLVYNFQQQGTCGFITDFHDGYFGTLMYSMITRFCGGAGIGESVCTESVLLDSNADTSVVIQNVVAWMVAKAFP
jgi:hypothetical protein